LLRVYHGKENTNTNQDFAQLAHLGTNTFPKILL
jgi:hypothetical protein